MPDNFLYHGDNYNVLFHKQNGNRSAAKIHAFEDTWHWDQAAARAYQEIVETGGRVSQAIQGGACPVIISVLFFCGLLKS